MSPLGLSKSPPTSPHRQVGVERSFQGVKPRGRILGIPTGDPSLTAGDLPGEEDLAL